MNKNMEYFSQTTSNTEKIEKQEKAPVFLNEWDKKYLEKGAQGMIKKIFNDFKNNFPDVIILPERGARPLYYLLKPIFNKLNLEIGTKIPQFIYFSVAKTAGINLSIQEQYSDISTGNDLKEALTESYPNLPSETIQSLADREKVEEVMTSRKNMKERAEEINKKNKDNLKLAIVDEVLSNGATVQEIRKAFNDEILPAYTLVALSSHGGSAIPGYTFNEEDDDKNPGVDGYSFSFEYAKDALGIEKSIDQKYSAAIKKETPDEREKLAQEKKLLRTEMKAFGQELADKIHL